MRVWWKTVGQELFGFCILNIDTLINYSFTKYIQAIK